MSLGSGARLGSYEILALLGAGGMGDVYRAHDARLDRDVALKVLPDVSASGTDAPPDLARIVTRCVEKQPAARFQSAADLAFALRALLTAPADVMRRDISRPHQVEQASIVVLPFANLSSDPEQEYFSDGLTEEIIADLSTLRALRVISRTSAMKFKGTSKGAPDIARELHVRHVLEGSVRKAGNSLRITTQLIDAATDTHLWAEKFSGTLNDVFDLQEQLSRSIVGALRLTLTPSERDGLHARPSTSVAAYDCFLRARVAMRSFTKRGYDEAERLLLAGLSASPDDGLLLAGLAYLLAWYGNVGERPAELSRDKAEEAARRALALDPNLAQVHLALGYSYTWLRFDPQRGLHALLHAAALDPGDWDTHFHLTLLYVSVGRLPKALQHAERLAVLDPVESVGLAMVGFVHLLDGRPELGLEHILRAGP